jgi:hypothetical protein
MTLKLSINSIKPIFNLLSVSYIQTSVHAFSETKEIISVKQIMKNYPQFDCCIPHKIPTKAAPWENPSKPSNGPSSLKVFPMRVKLFSKPKQISDGFLESNILFSVLNHQAY